MNILALDTAVETLSIALSTETGVWYTEAAAGSRHSELLMELTDGLCKTAGLLPPDINLVACMQGPGSFTGLRIGFSAAKGLSMALGIPLVAVPTLDCLAYPLSVWPGIALPAIDAKKGCFFAALYRDGRRLTDYIDCSPEILAQEIIKNRLSPDEPVTMTGPGAGLLSSRLHAFLPAERVRVYPESRAGRAKELLKIAKSVIVVSGNTDSGEELQGAACIRPDSMECSGPVYIRKSDAEINRS